MNKKYPGSGSQWFFIFFYIFCFCPAIAEGQSSDNGYRLKTVIIDPGHGGKDPGSVGKKTTEKEVVLAVALKLGKYIEQNMKDVKVVYTRKTDVFVELYKRAEIANSHQADLFISIHANGSDNRQVSGSESLVLGTIRAGENFEVAKKENSVILLEEDYKERYEGFDPNVPESYQSLSLVQDLYLKKSVNFAALVQDQFRERALRKDRSVKQQSLLVLARTAMPGVLIELGFITNPDEEKYMMSEEGQDHLASAIYRAFRDYREIVESRSSLTALLGKHSYADSVLNSPVTVTEAQAKPADMIPAAPVANALPETKEDVIEFKVQIAASNRRFATNSELFKGEPGVKEYKVGTMYKYAIGSSRSFDEIVAYSKKVREKFSDAFVIAVKGDNIIPLKDALREVRREREGETVNGKR